MTPVNLLMLTVPGRGPHVCKAWRGCLPAGVAGLKLRQHEVGFSFVLELDKACLSRHFKGHRFLESNWKEILAF